MRTADWIGSHKERKERRAAAGHDPRKLNRELTRMDTNEGWTVALLGIWGGIYGFHGAFEIAALAASAWKAKPRWLALNDWGGFGSMSGIRIVGGMWRREGEVDGAWCRAAFGRDPEEEHHDGREVHEEKERRSFDRRERRERIGVIFVRKWCGWLSDGAFFEPRVNTNAHECIGSSGGRRSRIAPTDCTDDTDRK